MDYIKFQLKENGYMDYIKNLIKKKMGINIGFAKYSI